MLALLTSCEQPAKPVIPNPRAHKKNRRGVRDLLFGLPAGLIADVSRARQVLAHMRDASSELAALLFRRNPLPEESFFDGWIFGFRNSFWLSPRNPFSAAKILHERPVCACPNSPDLVQLAKKVFPCTSGQAAFQAARIYFVAPGFSSASSSSTHGSPGFCRGGLHGRPVPRPFRYCATSASPCRRTTCLPSASKCRARPLSS